MTSSPSAITTSSLDSAAWSTPPTSTSEGDHGEINPSVGNLSLDAPICFRICGIPFGWERVDLQKSLRNIYPKLDFQNMQLSALFPDCCKRTQTALLTVQRRLEEYILPSDDKEKYHSLRAADGAKEVRLRFDKHFQDLTPMNIPQPDSKINAE